MRVAVIGGGISGQRAALTLARAGHTVTLYEKNRFLGGRAFSFPVPGFGNVDIGQHVWLKCCIALEEYLRELAVPDDWVFRQQDFAIPYRFPEGGGYLFRSTPVLPDFMHLLPAVLRFPGLGPGGPFRLIWGMMRARWCSEAALEALDTVSFSDWLRGARQTPAAVSRLWEPLVLAVCNMRAHEVSARHALFTFRESLLKSRHAADICFLRRPLSEVFDTQARIALTRAGVEIATQSPIAAVRPGATPSVHLGGQECSFDRVILALPRNQSRRLLGQKPEGEPPRDTAIAGLLLKFAEPVMGGLFFASLGSPIQFVFNKTAVWGERPADGSQILEIVISGAEREARQGGERVRAELLPELAKLLPGVNKTRLVASRFLLHGGATFAVPPGGEARRPSITQSGIANIIFAGDAAATGWPSTMESAARAGAAAARECQRGLS